MIAWPRKCSSRDGGLATAGVAIKLNTALTIAASVSLIAAPLLTVAGSVAGASGDRTGTRAAVHQPPKPGGRSRDAIARPAGLRVDRLALVEFLVRAFLGGLDVEVREALLQP